MCVCVRERETEREVEGEGEESTMRLCSGGTQRFAVKIPPINFSPTNLQFVSPYFVKYYSRGSMTLFFLLICGTWARALENARHRVNEGESRE